MRILFIAREIPYPPNTGVRMRVWNILKRLSEHYALHLVCYGNKCDSVPAEVREICSSVVQIDPLPVLKMPKIYFTLFIGLFSPLPYAVKSRFSLKMKQEINRLMHSQQINLVICDSLYLALHVPLSRCKTILNEHNIESVIIDRYAKVETNIVKKLYARYELLRMRAFESRVWKKFDQCFVCSDIDKQEIQGRTNHQDVVVIPNGVAIEVPTLDSRRPALDTSRRLVYTGLISWKPNEDAVLYFLKDIYPLIKKKISTVTFDIVGKGPSERIKKLAQEDPSVVVTGFVDDIRSYILQSDIVVVPLRIGSGTRLKILEAWALGKAIVSTSIGCEGLDAKDNENIMIADDPEHFSDKIVTLLNNADLKMKLEHHGRRLVEEKYDWEVIGKKIKQEIEKL